MVRLPPRSCAYRRAVADELCRDVACSAERAAPGECRGAGELYLGLMSSLFFSRLEVAASTLVISQRTRLQQAAQEVSLEIFGVFQPDGQPQQVRTDGVVVLSPPLHERLHPAKRRRVAEKLEQQTTIRSQFRFRLSVCYESVGTCSCEVRARAAASLCNSTDNTPPNNRGAI